MRKRLHATGLALLLMITAAAHATGPNDLNFQGRVTDALGQPITGTVTIRVSIYNVATGGSSLWSSGSVNVQATDGLFALRLGESPQPALPINLFDQSDLWIGVAVEPDPEMTPRTKLSSTAWSHRVRSVEADQIVDEPGVAQTVGFVAGQPGFIIAGSTTAAQIIDSVDLATPGLGFVIVTASFTAINNGEDQIQFGLSQSNTLAADQQKTLKGQISVSTVVPVSVTRVFQVTTRGQVRYYLIAQRVNGLSQSAGVRDLTMTALFVPTAYGAVEGLP